MPMRRDYALSCGYIFSKSTNYIVLFASLSVNKGVIPPPDMLPGTFLLVLSSVTTRALPAHRLDFSMWKTRSKVPTAYRHD